MAKNGKRAFIGIDIGGTKSLFALFNERFEVLAQEKFRTHPERGGVREFTRQMGKVVEGFCRDARKRGLRLKAVGVGCAGDIDLKNGIVRESPNLAFLDGYDFRAKLEHMTGGRVFVGHDVQSGLYGEFRLGAARKARHVIGVWIGTGVGGALIIDGKLHLGASGMAGDIGNYLLHSVDTASEAPRKDVLDNVASRTAIAGEAAALAAKRRAPTLLKMSGTDVNEITSSDIAEAIRGGDKMIEKLVRSRARVVGAAVSNFVDFLDPDMVVLGGGLVESLPALIRNEVRKSVQAHCSPKIAKGLKVKVSKLKGHAVTAGAAKMAEDIFYGHSPIDLERL